ncbi:MAG: putative signal transduction protein with EAL and GGDEF domain [Vicingaceae bacterium]|jgi:predicted signal transduction protein with EAL and GGDEF domain
METNIDLKKIWNKQNIETPKVEILYAKANKLKIRSFLKLIVVNITLLLTITFIGFIWYYYQPELVTTKIGIILTILAMIIFLLPYNKQFSLLSKTKTEPNSKEYLQQLIKLKEKQTFQQTTMLSVYFIILSLGIGLYLFEYASRMTITWGIITYAITILWFAINWFYLRPKTITKQNAKLNKLLVEFEKLNKQMND